MQSENFDKKIRDSLSQRPPGNEYPRWDKMEPLLDTHMPRKKEDNRRVLIVLFLFLLLGGGAFIIWKYNNGDKQNISSVSKDNKTLTPEESASNTSPSGSITPDATNSTGNKTDQLLNDKGTVTSQEPLQQSTKISNINQTDRNQDPRFLVSDATVTKKKTDKTLTDPTLENNNNAADRRIVTNDVNEQNKTGNIAANDDLQKQNEAVKQNENVADANKPAEKNTNSKNELATETKQPETKKKNNGTFFNNLFFTLSAGPDYSMVKFDGGGKVELAKGVGIGYQISDKFSIRTGFYSARKVYYADPEDYDPPANFWQWYPNLESIDANCKVYEIPVTVDYTFGSNKKHNWFASAGVSSLIMKEETYDYYFKPNYSPNYVTYSKTYENENKHLFSVLNLSGGYRRNINKNISVQAEPYMKFAMTGVGFGRVKLNSGGVLFSAVIKPFAKR